MKRLLPFSLMFLLVFGLSFSQTGQIGKIQGTVTDEEGIPLPGVTVTITSPALIAPQISRITSESGVFRFPSLPPGTYQVTFELPGFNTKVRKGIIVSANKTTSLDITMSVATVEEEITVVGESPTVDRQATTKTVTIDDVFITTIPATRTFGTYFNMTPGVTGSTSHGGSVRDNVYSIDGVNTADAAVGTEALFFSMDTVEEISVQTGGLSAEHGQVRGAIVNAVSKSGGNEFHGSVNIYYRGENFQSNNTKGTPLEGEETGFKYEMEPGFSVGGPIIRDKLWFFANGSFWKQERIVSGYPYDKDKETGVDQFRPYPYLKLTFQPNPDNKFIASYRFSDIRRHHRGASRYNTEDTTWEQETPTNVINLHYTRFFGTNFFMNVKAFAYMTDFNLFAKNDKPNYWEYTTNLNSGSFGYSDLYTRDRYSIEADGTVYIDDFAGAHEMKMGVEYMFARTSRYLDFNRHPVNGMSFINTYYGSPWYGIWYAVYDQVNESRNLGVYIQDAWNISNRLTANVGLRFDRMQGIYPPQLEDEGEQELFGYTYNRGITESITAYTWNTLSPRLGLIYDLMGDGKTMIKASFSRYYLANLTQWVSRGNPNGWVYYYGPLNPDYTLAGLWGLAVSGPEYAPKYGYGDYDFKAAYTDELIVGVEREIFEDASLGIRYIRKWDRDLAEDADANNIDIDKLLSTGEYDWLNYTPVTATDPHDGSTVTFWEQVGVYVADAYMINPPDAKRDYDGVEVTFDKRYSHGWQLKVSYVWQKSRGLVGTDFGDSWSGTAYYENPNAHINAMGRFPYERRHQLKVQGMIRGPFGINFGTYFRYLSGRRYTRRIRSTDLGLDLFQGSETIYAEERGSTGYPGLYLLDVKLEKEFRIGRTRFAVFGDVFSVLNTSTTNDVYTISSNPSIDYQKVEGIEDPRIFRIGARFEF
ncbi:MAG: TonB-dependent receptor domain-containing protein [Candidatus Aminicenantes bacterium]